MDHALFLFKKEKNFSLKDFEHNFFDFVHKEEKRVKIILLKCV